ncbi:MAG TPA: S1-like domain-containing RNA-binding protein [Bacteroidota bacterium]|nr:S1-like domain-containing RNA-binding protein [Bacteroidota bacterium]
MTAIGQFNTLSVLRAVEFGVYLDGGELGEILLPQKYVPEGCKPGDTIEGFIYTDSEDRLVATTERPRAKAGEFAFLKVHSVTSVGAFLDWGLSKHLLVPFREQKVKMEQGKSYVVYVYVDEHSRRMCASSRLDKFLARHEGDFETGQEVDLLLVSQSELGFNAIINGARWGILYHNEVFQLLRQGQHVTGYIKKLREDGKIDLSLQKQGYAAVQDVTSSILAMLRARGGFIDITDKSSPDDIYELFGMSKKTYKKAIGALYKQRLITIEDNGIRLVPQSDQAVPSQG